MTTEPLAPNPWAVAGRWVCAVLAAVVLFAAIGNLAKGNTVVGVVCLVIAVLVAVESVVLFRSVAKARRPRILVIGTPPYLPSTRGLPAVRELDRVDWSLLRHAYGQGVTGDELHEDVPRALGMLRRDPDGSVSNALWSSLCHQGTVYEASAYALPFLAAVAAGRVPDSLRAVLVDLVAAIAVGGSQVAPQGYRAGAWGEGVDVLVQQTVLRCEPFLRDIAAADRSLAPLMAAIVAVASHPSDETRLAVERLADADGPSSRG